MEPNENQERQRRASCLAILLAGAFSGFILVLLVLATGGWAVYLLWIAGGVGAFALLHYLLWGRLLLRQTAGEREEEELRRRAEEREQNQAAPGRDGESRYS